MNANYATPVWSTNYSESNMDKIQHAQNEALRIVTGSHKMTSIDHLHIETKMLQVEDNLNLLSAQYLVHCWAQRTYVTTSPCLSWSSNWSSAFNYKLHTFLQGRRPVGRQRRTGVESVEVDMVQLEIDKEDVHDRKKWRRNVIYL